MNNETMASQPTKNPELNLVQEETDIALKELTETVAHLTSRLLRVMSPPQLETAKVQQDPRYCSKLAQEIDLHNENIRSINSALSVVLDRLEI